MTERIAKAMLDSNNKVWKVIVPGLLLIILVACLVING